MTCTKRAYESREAALAAHRRAGYRIKVYRCPACAKLHTSNADKTENLAWQAVPRKRTPRRQLELAPARTLAEVEALAAEKRARHVG